MSRRATVALAVSVASAVAVATAAATSTTTFTLHYSTSAPHSSTGFDYASETSDPASPGAMPQPVRELKVTFQPGTEFDTTVPARCRASNAELHDRGERACPITSEIGSGEAVVVSGFGPPVDPIKETITAFNTRGSIVFYLRGDPPARTLVLRATLRGRTLNVKLPHFCLPGGRPPTCQNGEAVLIEFALRTRPVSRIVNGARRNYATTPPRCPNRRWTTRGTFTYKDGSRQNVTSTSRCAQR